MHGLVRSLINGNCDEFRERFEYFLDSSPSFLHSVGKDHFFPAFFFSMFATAHDAGVAGNNERIFFRFDNDPGNPGRGNLKVAVLTDDRDEEDRRIVRCYTTADRENSYGSRFSQQERERIEDILQGEELEWQEYKTFIWADNLGEDEEEEAVRCRQFPAGQAFIGGHASYFTRRYDFREITRTPRLQNNYLPNLIRQLESNDSIAVRNANERVFRYIISVYDRYSQALDFYGKESDHHGFLSGFFMHFRYRNVANIYLELFVGGGQADTTSLVRGGQRLMDITPCITEIKAGRGQDRYTDRALAQARNYVSRCPVSSISIYTSSEEAVCVGVNPDLNNRRLQLDVENFLARGNSLVERLFESVENEEIEENVMDYLLYPAFGVPAVPGIRNRGDINARDRRVFLYTTGFAFASIAFAKGTVLIGRNRVRVDKHLFHYDGNAKMLDEQRQNTQVNVRDRVLTMVLHVSQGRDQREELVVFHIRHVLANQRFPNNGLDLSRWPNAMVHEVVCNLTINRRRRGANDNLGLTVAVETFNSPIDYLLDRGNQAFQGEFLRIGGVGNVHRAAKVMMNTGWENEDPGSHEELYQAISKVLNPPQPNNVGLQSLAWIVNRDNARETGFHAILHGLFYICDNPDRVISEFQVGGGGKLDLVLLRASGRRGGTHPVGKELKFAATGAQVQAREQEADNQLAVYENSRGFDRITDGNKMVFSYVVFNDQAPAPAAQDVPNTLISVTHPPHALRVKRNLGGDGVNDFPYR